MAELASPNRPLFWGELAASEHCVQIYTDDSTFLDALHDFVAGGLVRDESVVVILTPRHRQGLEERLAFSRLRAAGAGRYIPLDAEETLARFMVGAWPDDCRFERVVTAILNDARRDTRGVRAFGEMVAVLWAQGHHAATARLEYLWSDFVRRHEFPLVCAYPRVGFTEDPAAAILSVCAAHSRVIPG